MNKKGLMHQRDERFRREGTLPSGKKVLLNESEPKGFTPLGMISQSGRRSDRMVAEQS